MAFILTLDEKVLHERFDSIHKALFELDRLKVAYARNLQNSVQPPDVNILAKAGMALRELQE